MRKGQSLLCDSSPNVELSASVNLRDAGSLCFEKAVMMKLVHKPFRGDVFQVLLFAAALTFFGWSDYFVNCGFLKLELVFYAFRFLFAI